MLLWLISAAKVPASRVRAARAVAATLPSLQRRSAAIRKIVPWEMVAERLWPSKRRAAAVLHAQRHESGL
jgi:hypothetical protein